MIEKVLGDHRTAADRRPVVTFEDNVAFCAQAKVRMQTRFFCGKLNLSGSELAMRSWEIN
jgi:hypothetical protein